MVIITMKWLKEIAHNGHINREQMILLGMTYPLPQKWKWSLIGKELTDERAFAIREASGPGVNQRKAANFHAGKYLDEVEHGNKFHVFYTRGNGKDWAWSYKPLSSWPTSFLTNEKGEVIF